MSVRAYYIGALLLLCAYGGGCFESIPGGPPVGYETDELSCSDGRDNDQDGQVDCEDTDCLMRNFCGVFTPQHPTTNAHEDTFKTCTDGIDNDDDGQFDCGDSGCANIAELCCIGEISDVLCSDGLDNDGNGFTDCEDFYCRRSSNISVCDREFLCDDGLDNDRDGAIDGVDRDCQEEWSPIDCHDGVDNDGDDLVDCDDPNCCPTPEEDNCSDNIDNDDDGLTDNEDFDCNPAVTENTLADCSDGIDNDENTYTDCADNTCRNASNGAAADAVAYCQRNAEDTEEKCQDGEDNDGNGFPDCSDFSCQAIAGLCGTPEESMTTCTDGIDNDSNGFADCDDRSCVNFVRDLLEAPNPATREIGLELADKCEYSLAACTDGTDNNGNGFTDCNDFSCRALRDFCAGANCPAADSDPATYYTSNCDEAGTPLTTRPDQASVEAIKARCSNGIDEDGDGFFDCDDFDCQWHPWLLPAATNPNPTEQGFCQTQGKELICI